MKQITYIRAILTILALLFITSFSKVAIACECYTTTPVEDFIIADTVFIGYSLKDTELAHSMFINRFLINERLKPKDAPEDPYDGPAPEITLLQDMNKCAYKFKSGLTYKIFATRTEHSSGMNYTTSKCLSNNIEWERSAILSLADKEALSLGYNIQKMSISFDRNNSNWKNYLSSFKNKGATEQYVHEHRLKDKEFWAVYYEPFEKNKLGGDLWVFIDIRNGDTLSVLRGQ